MNKEELTAQADKIYRALNAISVSGYGNIKTLGNCLDAMAELTKNIASYEEDIRNAVAEEIKKVMEEQAMPVNETGITPVNPDKPRPKRNTKGGEDVGEN